ncbi:MAG: methyltransferase domain-containing protein [Casimicrobium sp.]
MSRALRALTGARCFLCGSLDVASRPYLSLNSDSFARNAAYLLPAWVARALAHFSRRFGNAYHPVAINKRYFNRSVCYCNNCLTGACLPFFEKTELADYYERFYWRNRDAVDGNHLPLSNRPNDHQVRWTAERIAWLEKSLGEFGTVLDFGAGDCAAGFALTESGKALSVHVVDPSMRSRDLANAYGFGYSPELAQAPQVDFIYSAHSIEHVHDLLDTVLRLTEKVRDGGHIFFETPNIGDLDVFAGLAHTPHTFMLSRQTFMHFETLFPLKIVAIEATGPRWQRSRPRIESFENTDLRVLLRKVSKV